MFGFESLFDTDRDGKLDTFEQALEFQFVDEFIMEEEKKSEALWDDDSCDDEDYNDEDYDDDDDEDDCDYYDDDSCDDDWD